MKLIKFVGLSIDLKVEFLLLEKVFCLQGIHTQHVDQVAFQVFFKVRIDGVL